MARKIIYRKLIRFYEGEEDLVQAIEALDISVIVNEHLKEIIRETLLENDVPHSPATQPAQVDAEALAKELLPQIRKVVEGALTSHTIFSNDSENANTPNEDTQQKIQEGLKKLGQSMM